MKKLNLFGPFLILKELPPDEKTAGGIVLPASLMGHTNELQKAKVVMVGPGYKTNDGYNALSCKEGDIVYYDRAKGGRYTLDGEDVTILQEHDLLGREAE